MKKQIVFSLLLLVSIGVNAQLRKIPVEVTEAFKTRYPHAEKVSWKDKISSFQASFIINNKKMTADFSGKGDWERTEKKLSFEELPREIADGFSKSKYSDWEKGSVIEVDEDGEAIVYRVLVKKSTLSKKYLYFDSNGKLLKESMTL